MRVLFYYPSNKRTNAMETLMFSLKAHGHEVWLLTNCEKGDFHTALEAKNIPTFTSGVKTSNALLFYLKNIIQLRKFCRKNNIDVVFSHLQRANIIAVYAKTWSKAKYFIFRHHGRYLSKGLSKAQQNELKFDNIINKKAKNIYVPSSGVKQEMQQHEKVNASNIHIIPYVYDFSQYPAVHPENVIKIKADSPGVLRLLYCSRFVNEKRPEMAVEAVLHLLRKGQQVHLFLLDEGPELEKIKMFCSQSGYATHFHFKGFTRNLQDYMAACDVLLHPSCNEASNSTVKEMALHKKTVIVCRNTGDFNDYLVHGQNAFLVNKDEPLDELKTILEKIITNQHILDEMGRQLYNDVIEKFAVSETSIQPYLNLLHQT